jgi:cysteine synthase
VSNVFGSSAEYLNPRNLPPLPLVELPARLVPFTASENVHVYAQLAYEWPTTRNLKHPAVHAMLFAAKERGQLRKKAVESSSGNTLISLAILAPFLGIEEVHGIVPADIPKVKWDRLTDLGVILRKNYARPGQPNAIEEARMLGRQEGWFHLRQYENEWNWRGHMKYTTGPVLTQLGERLSVYGVGLGTAGTAIAARETFKGKPVAVVAGICAPDNPVPGVRTRQRLQNFFDWENGLHHVEVGQREAYRGSLELVSAGIRGGPSSGFARAALNKFLLQTYQNPEAWKNLRNGGEIVAAFVCGDEYDLYRDSDKYSTILDPEDFPEAKPSEYQI